MSNKKQLQQIFGLTLVVLLLIGCSGAPIGPTATPTPVPPTATPTPMPPTPTITPAPPPSCLKEPPPGLMRFALSGDFEPAQPPPMEESLNPDVWNEARLLVCDDSFVIEHEKGDYNLWTGLLEVEESTPEDKIPHMLAPDTKTVGEIVKEYGEPSFVGEFRLSSGEVLKVYWFGPIFIMAEGLDGKYKGVGGWISLLQ